MHMHFIDSGIVWVHRTTNALYDGLYDVTGDGTVNFIDAGLIWVNEYGMFFQEQLKG